MKSYRHIGFITAAVVAVLILIPPVDKAQSGDSTDVKYLVQKQIEEAKKKNAEVEDIDYQVPVTKTPAKKAVVETNLVIGIPGEYFYKGLIMLTGAFMAFLWLAMRKTKREKVFQKNQFKKNIKLMREEKFIKEIDPKLKEIRTRLTLTSVVLNEDKQISAAARRSQIGKEEIILASRMRSHEMQYGRQRSLA